MDRRRLLRASIGMGMAAVAGGVVGACASEPRARSGPFRVGVLHLVGAAAPNAGLSPQFLEALREAGLVEGRDLSFEFRHAEFLPERLPALASELVASKPDLIFAPSHVAAVAAKEATKDIPIVMVQPFDAADTGLVSSLARPGGNLTGTTLITLSLMQKRMELLIEVAPRAARVAYITTVAPPITDVARASFEEAARSRGLQTQVLPIRAASELDPAFATMVAGAADALFVLETNLFATQRARIGDLGLRHRIPTIAGERLYAEAGALLSYGVVYAELYRRAGVYVAKILAGARPADLPVEAAARFELALNKRTAAALGMTFPPTLLSRADAVIE